MFLGRNMAHSCAVPVWGRWCGLGENYTDENITPVGSRGGSGGGGKQPLYMTLNFPQGAVENMLIGTVDDLYRQNRITVDLTG